jgi:hypothetical protein
VLEAPVGHRQPAMGDLPAWLRQKEGSGERSQPAQHSEPATHKGRESLTTQYEAPPTDIPPICRGC